MIPNILIRDWTPLKLPPCRCRRPHLQRRRHGRRADVLRRRGRHDAGHRPRLLCYVADQEGEEEEVGAEDALLPQEKVQGQEEGQGEGLRWKGNVTEEASEVVVESVRVRERLREQESKREHRWFHVLETLPGGFTTF